MKNNIHKDLKLFNDLVAFFLEDEIKNPVAKYIAPTDVEKEFELKLGEEGIDAKDLRSSLKKLLLQSPKSSSKLFFNQLFGGRHSKAVLGDLLAVMLNNSMATYKIAGPNINIEKEVLIQIYNLIGYGDNAGGTFPTGGSMSNFMSLIMARDKIDSKAKDKGALKKLVAYTSENSHYSMSKNASLSGIGRENVRYIRSDQYGRLNILEFINQVKLDKSSGLIPFYLNATAGTTVLGAFDNISNLAPICKDNNIWLHLDGAFGGSVIFLKSTNI